MKQFNKKIHTSPWHCVEDLELNTWYVIFVCKNSAENHLQQLVEISVFFSCAFGSKNNWLLHVL